MKILNIKLRKRLDNSYKIYIGRDIFNEVCANLAGYDKVAVITDSNVKKLYGDALLHVLKKKGIDVVMFCFPAGERSKSRETKEKIEDLMISKEFNRRSIVVALGGGVTGDLAGFTASTFMRGIPYLQVPTTLLSMVDSSIGGKTGVDTPYGKNLVGSFHQPNAVLIDIDFVKSLPDSELANGAAEMIKHAIISDESYFKFLIQNSNKILREKDRDAIESAVSKSIAIKSKIVEKDELETGERRKLNFGHTIGHSIEKLSEYSINHGSAVALGIIAESRIAYALNLLRKSDLDNIINIVSLYGFKTKLEGLDIKRIMEETRTDKKNEVKGVNYSVPTRIGKVIINVRPSEDVIIKSLGEMI